MTVLNSSVLSVLLIMEIVIIPEDVGFSASISSLHIHTQWDTFDELLYNIREAIDVYYEEEKEYSINQLDTNRFYFSLPKIYNANSI